MTPVAGRLAGRHVPRLLAEAPNPRATELVRDARDGRLILYVGAGLSVAPPASGPQGSIVADRLRSYVAEILGVANGELAGLNLEALGQRVADEAHERMGDLKDRAAVSQDFRNMEPNYGHEVVAMLLREGLAQVVSVNWDLGIETAGLRLEITIEGVANAAQRQQLPPTRYPLYKVHGCASQPGTLQLTQAEVNDPPRWAVAEVQRALAGGTVLFIGLGTVGVYVSEPVAELIPLWTEAGATTIRVIDRDGISAAWRAALGEEADAVEVASSADAFLDEFLRAVVLAALSNVDHSIRLIAEEEAGWADRMLEGCLAIRQAFESSTADSVLRWWRDGVRGLPAGQQFVFGDAGRQALMGVARIVGEGGGEIVAQGSGEHLTLKADSGYLEILCRPAQLFRKVDEAARERIRRRREAGLYGDGGLVTVVVHGTEGSFPAPTAPVNIAGSSVDAPSLAAGAVDGIRLVKAERLVAGEAFL